MPSSVRHIPFRGLLSMCRYTYSGTDRSRKVAYFAVFYPGRQQPLTNARDKLISNLNSVNMKISIFYSPQPDENPDVSAAHEYAKRISDVIAQDNSEKELVGNDIGIDRLSMDSLKFMNENTAEETAPNTTEETAPPQYIFIILSCSADGSTDRIVRKLTRSMNSKPSKTEEIQTSHQVASSAFSKGRIAIALLGHARCENSAQQMKDTIFSNGRKFHQRLFQNIMDASQTKSGVSYWDVEDILEAQVELEGPDAPGGFDEWVTNISCNKL